jgi:hypothetical protein
MESDYLGLGTGLFGSRKGSSFDLKDIKAPLLVIEFLNTYCATCGKQARVVQRVLQAARKDPLLSEKVKFVGIGTGNNQRELTAFKKELLISYPLLSDPDYVIYEAIGDPGGIPLFFLLRPVEGKLLIAMSHRGLITSEGFLLKELQEAITATPKEIVARAADKTFDTYFPEPIKARLTDEELRKRIDQDLKKMGYTLVSLEGLALSDMEFCAKVKTEEDIEKALYYAVVWREPICGVCHPVYFMFAFDEDGTIRSFVSIHLTKLNNEIWSATDVLTFQLFLMNKSIFSDIAFDPPVDAVSTATLSCSLIVNSVERTGRGCTVLKKR